MDNEERTRVHIQRLIARCDTMLAEQEQLAAALDALGEPALSWLIGTTKRDINQIRHWLERAERGDIQPIPDFRQALGAIPLQEGMPTAAEAIRKSRDEA